MYRELSTRENGLQLRRKYGVDTKRIRLDKWVAIIVKFSQKISLRSHIQFKINYISYESGWED